MLTIHCMPTPQYLSCAYLIVHDRYQEAIIIDPGNPDIAPLTRAAELCGLSVPFIILTHEHFDHIAGVNAARECFGSRLLCSQACAQAILDPKKNLSRYLIQRDVVIGPADVLCEDHHWRLPWSDMELRLMPTPGHSPGGICIGLDNCLFSGDTILGNRNTRTNLPGGHRSDLQQSVTRIFNEFKPDTVVYPGHGTHFLLAQIDPLTVLGSGHRRSRK